ncbi:MAG TPA: hypothetical protein VEB39_10530 [Sphingomicrobium sp.]|nr:hypothetical protein [Sphingomicrobium sp.]
MPSAPASPTARLGEVAHTNGLKVRPLRVIEDSRCPINAVCVWAGRLVLRVEIEGGAGADTADLTLGQPLNVGGTLTLVSAEPSKQAGVAIDPRAYRFTFSFQRRL